MTARHEDWGALGSSEHVVVLPSDFVIGSDRPPTLLTLDPLPARRIQPMEARWRRSPLVFSFVPRCHGEYGSAKYTAAP
jgi:hypothetical protein